MIVHELNNDVSTVRIHDDCYETDSTRFINSASRVVSASYKRRYLSEQKAESVAIVMPDPQPMIATLQA